MFADSKTLKEEKREELYENLKLDKSLGWAVDVIGPRELSAKMLAMLVVFEANGFDWLQMVVYNIIAFGLFSYRNKINLNEISHNSTMGLIKQVLDMGVLLTEVIDSLSMERSFVRECHFRDLEF